MMDKKTFFSQMLTPGTGACTVLGIVLGLIIAVLCMVIGVGKTLLIVVFCLAGAFVGGVKDKREFARKVIQFFYRK